MKRLCVAGGLDDIDELRRQTGLARCHQERKPEAEKRSKDPDV